jgi:hypothetical protein
MERDNIRKETKIKKEKIEDGTLYPEFIPTFDRWLSSEIQRENAKHLEEIAELTDPKDIKRRPR